MRTPARLSASLPLLCALAAAAGPTGSAAARGRPKPTSAVEIGVASVHRLGRVITTGRGRVLYMFAPDGRSKVTCNAQCQKIWPPVVAPRRGVARAIDGARQSLIGSVRNPADGRRIVTYNGWPLYEYVLDTRPREATGQNVLLNGGFWWVLTPKGQLNRTPVPHGSGIAGS